MKKLIKIFLFVIAFSFSVSGMQTIKASTNYSFKKVILSGRFSDTKQKNSHKKIIRTYKELKTLKKYIKKNYNNPEKYLKKLKKYKKSYFKKKSLIFATQNLDVMHYKYSFDSMEIDNEKVYINVSKKDTAKPDERVFCSVKYQANTYMIEVKKKKIKDVRKIKIKLFEKSNNKK